MKFIENWDKIKSRYEEYWSMENHDRPIMYITAPNGKKPAYIKAPEKISDRWLDTEYVLKCARNYFETTYYTAEGYPLFNPNLGPDIFGAIIGCNIEFGEDTSWSQHFVEHWEDTDFIKFNPENIWWKRIESLTKAAVEDAKGDYFVGITDIHPGMDALVSLRGPENLCLDMLDVPELVRPLPLKLFEVYKEVYNRLHSITTQNLGGTANWMMPWHPGKWYVTSCDFICLISPDSFEEFVLPELIEQTRFLDGTIFHLDGPGALKHLDRLLQIEGINGIQWVPGAGAPPVSEWKDVLVKIQEAGKLLQLSISVDEIEKLAGYLKPEGVMLNIWAGSKEEADFAVETAQKAFCCRRFY